MRPVASRPGRGATECAMTTFSAGAEAYDQYMGRWSQRLAAPFVEFASIDGSSRVLDVGCGPGALTAELASRLGPGAVTAVDPSPSFVVAAQRRHPGVEVREASAERLPFPDASFGAALAQLVVHFMGDPVAGLREMARVTRAGGVVAACVWDYAGKRGPLGPFWDAAQAVDPAVEGEAGLPGARDGSLAALLVAAGLEDVRDTVLTVEREFESFEAWWEPFTLGIGPGGTYVARVGAAQAAAIRERCRSMLPATGAFVLRASAWAARGTVA
jgi:SAM-dependent methyltransferase